MSLSDFIPSPDAVRIWQETLGEHYEEVRGLDQFEANVARDLVELNAFLLSADARTKCILVVSFLEDTLKQNFTRYWKIDGPSQTDAFFGSNGPLNTFSQRTLIARGLTWLSPEMAVEASTLRKIRNLFAHNHRLHSLLQSPLAEWAESLKHREDIWRPISVYDVALERAEKEVRLGLRVFCSATLIAAQLLGRSKLEKNGLVGFLREDGYKGLTGIEQSIMNATIDHCWRVLGLPRETRPDE